MLFVVPDRPWLAWVCEGGRRRGWTPDLSSLCWAPGLSWSIADWMTFLFPWGCFAEHNYMQHLTTELVIYVLLEWRRKGIGVNINVLWEDSAAFPSLLGTGDVCRREDANWSLGELTKNLSPFRMMFKGDASLLHNRVVIRGRGGKSLFSCYIASVWWNF